MTPANTLYKVSPHGNPKESDPALPAFKTPPIQMSRFTWEKIRYLINKAKPQEVGMYAVLDPQVPGRILDVYVPKQTVTGASTTFDDEALSIYSEQLRDSGQDTLYHFSCWIHSHPFGDVVPSPSGADQTQFDRLASIYSLSYMLIFSETMKYYAHARVSKPYPVEIPLSIHVEEVPFFTPEQTKEMDTLLEAALVQLPAPIINYGATPWGWNQSKWNDDYSTTPVVTPPAQTTTSAKSQDYDPEFLEEYNLLIQAPTCYDITKLEFALPDDMDPNGDAVILGEISPLSPRFDADYPETVQEFLTLSEDYGLIPTGILKVEYHPDTPAMAKAIDAGLSLFKINMKPQLLWDNITDFLEAVDDAIDKNLAVHKPTITLIFNTEPLSSPLT